jgi:hypothetical protein
MRSHPARCWAAKIRSRPFAACRPRRLRRSTAGRLSGGPGTCLKSFRDAIVLFAVARGGGEKRLNEVVLHPRTRGQLLQAIERLLCGGHYRGIWEDDVKKMRRQGIGLTRHSGCERPGNAAARLRRPRRVAHHRHGLARGRARRLNRRDDCVGLRSDRVAPDTSSETPSWSER